MPLAAFIHTRDDHSETGAAEQRREERRDVLKLFIDFLTACNRANVLYALPGDGADKEARRKFSDLVDDRWAAVQGGGVVFMAVGRDHETREAISGLIDAMETLTARLRAFQRPTAEQMHDIQLPDGSASGQCATISRGLASRPPRQVVCHSR